MSKVESGLVFHPFQQESKRIKIVRSVNCTSTCRLLDLPDLLLSLLVLTYFLHFPSPEYVNMIKRLCRKLLYVDLERFHETADKITVNSSH